MTNGSTRSTKVPFLTTEIEIVGEVTCAGRRGATGVVMTGVTTATGLGATFAWSRKDGIPMINALTTKERWSAVSELCMNVKRRRRQRQGKRFRRRRGDRCRRQQDDRDRALWFSRLGGRRRPHLRRRVRADDDEATEVPKSRSPSALRSRIRKRRRAAAERNRSPSIRSQRRKKSHAPDETKTITMRRPLRSQPRTHPQLLVCCKR